MLPVLLLALSATVSALPVSQAPQTCKYEAANYSLSWRYDDLSSDVVFQLTARSEFKNFWTGIYFGEETPNDVIGIFVRSGQIGMIDGHFGAENAEGKREVSSDSLTNVQSLSFDVQDGLLTAEFARPIVAADDEDADLGKCITFFAPVNAEEISTNGPISLPSKVEQFRVCDIASTCPSRDNEIEIVKRADAPVCDFTGGNGKVSWKKGSDGIDFTIEAPVQHGKHWSAVAVGESMADLKMAVVFTENGKVRQAGGYTVAGYRPPNKEKSLKVAADKELSKVADGASSIHFTAPMEMFSNTDPNGCVTLQIAVNAGEYKGNFNIGKHQDTPIPVTVCGIEKCGEEEEKEPKEETSEKPEAAVSEKTEEKEEDGEKETGSVSPIEEAQPLKKVAPLEDGEEQSPKAGAEQPIEQAEGSGEGSHEGSGEMERVQTEDKVQTVEGVRHVGEDDPAPLSKQPTEGAAGAGHSDTDKDGAEFPEMFSGVTVKGDEKNATNEQSNNASFAPDVGVASVTPPTVLGEGVASVTPPTGNEVVGALGASSPVPDVGVASVTPPTGSPIGQPEKIIDDEDDDDDDEDNELQNVTQAAVPASSTVASGNNATDEKLSSERVEEREKITEKPESGHDNATSSSAVPEVAPKEEKIDTPATEKPTVSPAGAGSTSAQEKKKLTVAKCEENHNDLRVCEGYFADYLGKVALWAEKHHEAVGQQLWKIHSSKQIQRAPTVGPPVHIYIPAEMKDLALEEADPMINGVRISQMTLTDVLEVLERCEMTMEIAERQTKVDSGKKFLRTGVYPHLSAPVTSSDLSSERQTMVPDPDEPISRNSVSPCNEMPLLSAAEDTASASNGFFLSAESSGSSQWSASSLAQEDANMWIKGEINSFLQILALKVDALEQYLKEFEYSIDHGGVTFTVFDQSRLDQCRAAYARAQKERDFADSDMKVVHLELREHAKLLKECKDLKAKTEAIRQEAAIQTRHGTANMLLIREMDERIEWMREQERNGNRGAILRYADKAGLRASSIPSDQLELYKAKEQKRNTFLHEVNKVFAGSLPPRMPSLPAALGTVKKTERQALVITIPLASIQSFTPNYIVADYFSFSRYRTTIDVSQREFCRSVEWKQTEASLVINYGPVDGDEPCVACEHLRKQKRREMIRNSKALKARNGSDHR